jgi:hypothetical protein
MATMKNVLIGCGVVVAVCIAAAVIGIALLAPKFAKLKNLVEDELAKEDERQKVYNEWVPPVKDVKDAQGLQEIDDDTVFPPTVGNDKRTGTDDNAAVPELSISLKGKHATYQVGSDTVDVYVYLATEAEKQAIHNSIQSRYNQGKGGSRRITSLGYRLFYESSEDGQNHLWSMKNGWFFVFRSTATEDKEEFVLAFLKAIDAKGKTIPNEFKPEERCCGDGQGAECPCLARGRGGYGRSGSVKTKATAPPTATSPPSASPSRQSTTRRWRSTTATARTRTRP